MEWKEANKIWQETHLLSQSKHTGYHFSPLRRSVLLPNSITHPWVSLSHSGAASGTSTYVLTVKLLLSPLFLLTFLSPEGIAQHLKVASFDHKNHQG